MATTKHQRTYRNWIIEHDPTPLPISDFDWHFYHKDFDGAIDSDDYRYGYAPTLARAVEIIDEFEDSQKSPGG